MATDVLAAAFPGPIWLLAFGVCLVVAVFSWRLVLGSVFREVGLRPLVVGLVCFVAASLGLCLIQASQTFFGDRVARGVFGAEKFWDIVPGWTVYLFAIIGLFGPAVLSVTSVPVAAMLVRLRRFSARWILTALAVLWIVPVVLFWLVPSNQWEETHRIDALVRDLVGSALATWLTGGAFFLGVSIGLRRLSSPSDQGPTRAE